MKRIERLCAISLILLIAIIFIYSNIHYSSAEDIINSRVQISNGLPQETASFSTVEVFDSDNDGNDEIFLGGAGFTTSAVQTEGIRAYDLTFKDNGLRR